MAELQEFHYMSVLRGLELEAGRLKGGAPESTSRQPVGRLMDVFSQAKQKLAQVRVARGEKISLNLKFKRDNQLKTEQAIVKNLRKLTEDWQPTDESRHLAGEWPPVIPVSRMVERFTALAIGLHAENPRAPFSDNAAAAFKTAVAPALAWGLMIRLYELPEQLREATQSKLVERLLDDRTPGAAEVSLGDEGHRKVRFPALRLVEAWHKLFASGSPCPLSAVQIRALREDLAARFRLPLGELDTRLWQELGGLYISTLAGSDRARAVAQAAGNAAFVRDRLVLFSAAMKAEVQDFRLRTEHQLNGAVQQSFVCEQPDAPDREKAGLEACGAAFWLARACFAKHGLPNEDAASARTLVLLLRAAVMLRHQPDWMATCVRYAAGFATNPRYTRSGVVLDFQTKLVDLYAKTPRARQALVEQFRGRIAWQQWKAGREDGAKARALLHYMKALELHDQGGDGLDSEGPVHFFPELVVLLGQADDGKRAAEDLATVDFITQRNYGIYFDIKAEESAIVAGLKEYARRQEDVAVLLAKLAKDQAAQVAAAEAAEQEALANGLEPEQVDGGSNWAALSQGADHKMCGALIAELRSGSTRRAA
jgi:hypothetical protein